MPKLYKNYAQALKAKTSCKFPLIPDFELPSLSFPPSIPIPDLSFTLPAPPFYCPLDS